MLHSSMSATEVVNSGPSPVEWLAAIGTVSAVVVALGGPWFWQWWFRPVLRFEYEPCEPFCRCTDMEIDGRRAKTRWIRLRIVNKGRGTARRCKAKLLAVFDANGTPRGDRDPMMLRWSATPEEHELEPLDLANGETRFLDVVFAHDLDTQWARIPTHATPPGFIPALEANREHRIRVAIYADNAEPHQEDFSVTYDGGIEGLAMNRV